MAKPTVVLDLLLDLFLSEEEVAIVDFLQREVRLALLETRLLEEPAESQLRSDIFF